MVVFGGLDSDDVPLSRLCTATVMVCGMGGEEREGEGEGGGAVPEQLHAYTYVRWDQASIPNSKVDFYAALCGWDC